MTGGPPVDGLPASVEDAPEHVLRHRRLEHVARELQLRVPAVNARGTFKDLHDGAFAVHFQHLPAAHAAVAEPDVDNLGVLCGLGGIERRGKGLR
jgi:hypothetical protein